MSIEYKVPDRAYVAKQFNGPIIAGFIKAVYNYLHMYLDHHCDYFSNLSIETANTPQLRFIGNLMGLQLFQLATDPSGGMYLVFTDEAFDTDEFEYDNGWAEVYREHQSGDGVFATGEETGYPIVLTTTQYRKILQALSQTYAASVSSLLLVDTLVNVLLDSTDYSISYNNGFTGVLNVVLGLSAPAQMTVRLQAMFDKLFAGADMTILVTHI